MKWELLSAQIAILRLLLSFSWGFYFILQSSCPAWTWTEKASFCLDQTAAWVCIFDQFCLASLRNLERYFQRLYDAIPLQLLTLSAVALLRSYLWFSFFRVCVQIWLVHHLSVILRLPAAWACVYLTVRPGGASDDKSRVAWAGDVDTCAAFSILLAVVLLCLCCLPSLSQPRNSNERSIWALSLKYTLKWH